MQPDDGSADQFGAQFGHFELGLVGLRLRQTGALAIKISALADRGAIDAPQSHGLQVDGDDAIVRIPLSDRATRDEPAVKRLDADPEEARGLLLAHLVLHAPFQPATTTTLWPPWS